MEINEEEIAKYRKDIDEADREIVRLIMKRALSARKIGEEKRKVSLPVYRPDREKIVYENIIRYAKEIYGEELPLPASFLVSIYREIMSASIAIEGGPGVAYMGPPASFSHIAVRQRFGSSVREYAVDTIPDVFRAVEAGREVSYGVVPVENSIEGSVNQTLDMFLESELKIYAELYVRIHLNLLYPGEVDLKDIKKLYTIKIVREQCRNWLQANLPSVEIVETPSSTVAASLASARKDGAAIASELAASTYDLDILARDIQDSANNTTRFLVIGREQCPPSGDDKSSILCAIRDRPGSLYELLKPFHEAGLNMTKIESRVTRRLYGDYNFFIDFLGHTGEERVKEILAKIEEKTSTMKVLGSYPRADMPE